MTARDRPGGQPIRQVLHPTADLWTSVEIRGDRALYTVGTTNAIYQQRLTHMGFAHAGAQQFIRNLSATGDVRRTHANFANHLEQMLLQSARLRPVDWEHALKIFLRRVEGTTLRWFLYGSGALAVRGINVEPGDLDFCVNDAQLAGVLFEELLVEPVTTMTDWIADCGGRAFAGCLFEWMAGVHPEVDKPTPHEQGPAAAQRLERARWRGHEVALAPLDLQLAVCEQRCLTNRAAKIRAHISRTGQPNPSY